MRAATPPAILRRTLGFLPDSFQQVFQQGTISLHLLIEMKEKLPCFLCTMALGEFLNQQKGSGRSCEMIIEISSEILVYGP